MRRPTTRQLLIVIAGCGGIALLAIVAAVLSGAVTPAIAVVLAVGSASLCGIVVLGLWIRRLDGKVQRVAQRLAREAARPVPAPRPPQPRPEPLEPRLREIEAAVARLGEATERLQERVDTVLATLGEDRVEAVYRHKHYTELLAGVVDDLRRVAAATAEGEAVRTGGDRAAGGDR